MIPAQTTLLMQFVNNKSINDDNDLVIRVSSVISCCKTYISEILHPKGTKTLGTRVLLSLHFARNQNCGKFLALENHTEVLVKMYKEKAKKSFKDVFGIGKKTESSTENDEKSKGK